MLDKSTVCKPIRPFERDSARFSTSGTFHESVSPKPLSIPLGPFLIFSTFTEIFAGEGATPVSLTLVANGKIGKSKKF